MAEFLITAPDGKKYKVTGATKEGALAALQAQLGDKPSETRRKAMLANIAAAKAGNIAVSPETAARQAEIDRPVEQQLRDPGGMYSFILGGQQGATFGFGDEIIGGVDAGVGAVGDLLSGNFSGIGERMGDRYAATRDDMRQAYSDAEFSRPKTTMAGNVIGAVVSPASKIGAGYVGAANTVGQAALRSGLVGSAMGAVQGFGMGEGFRDRLTSAGVGGLAGAAVGGAIPYIANGVGAGVRHVQDWLANRASVNGIADDLGISPQTARHVADAFGADDAGMMANNIKAAGPDAMLADASPAVQGALDGAMQKPGAASRIGMGQIEDRAAKSLGRVNATLDTVLGSPAGAETAKGAVRSGTSAARGTAYDAAYSVPIDYSSDAGIALEGVIPRLPAKAINDANLLMKLDGDASQQIMATIADDGSVAFQTMPDVRQWDYIKRALDHAASSGEGQGALGGQTAIGRAYAGLARTIRDTLKDAVPEYGTALNTSADAIQRVKAVDLGYSLLSSGTTREAAKDALDGMTDAELTAAKQGVRSFIDDTLANVRAVASDPNMDAREARKALDLLTSRASRDKMTALLGPDAGKVYAAISEAQKALGLRSAVAQNSKTFARQAFNERSRELSEPGAIRSGLGLRPIEAARKVAATVIGSTPEATARRADRVNAELVGLLTRSGQPQALNALAAIGNRISQNVPNPLSGQAAQNLLTHGGLGALPVGVNALGRALGF